MTIPLWLDPTVEILQENLNPTGWLEMSETTRSISGILISIKALKACERKLSLEQIFWIIGNSIVETGWFKKIPAYNMGGWKINKKYADQYKRINGKSAPWWQTAGHIASGDESVVYYRGYTDPAHFYSEWLERFVPSVPNLVAARYNKTGELFWQNKKDWFKELCLAGYKGPVTQGNPDNSVKVWESILHAAQVRVAQYLLGVKVDGKWGPKSQTAYDTFATKNKLPTGKITLNVLAVLLSEWEKNGSTMPVLL